MAERQEHWRLLYVAMTRAEEALFIGGALGTREKDGPAGDSWYARLKPLFSDEPLEDPIWGHRLEWGERAAPMPDEAAAEERLACALPDWVRLPVGPEPRPPRPLAPSSAGEEQGADPPLPTRLEVPVADFELASPGDYAVSVLVDGVRSVGPELVYQHV